jgi:amino acid adenylation domain-containing protein
MSESLADNFAEQAESQPEAPALIWDSRAISYGELLETASSAHSELEALGLPADRPVGIEARKSPEAIALILACLKAGRPFLLPSIELAPETLAKLFGQAGASRVLSTAEEGSDNALSAGEVPAEEDIPATEWPPPGGGDDIAFMLTTSGSTGLPKIVPLSEGAIEHFTDWAASQFGIGPGTRVLNYAPLNFDLCLLDIWSTLKAGGCVVLVDQAKATHGRYLVELLAGNEVDVVQAVPMLYRLLIDETRESGQRFPSVKDVITTGDKIPATSLAQLPELFPNARVFNVYGCTETNDSMMHEFDLTGEPPAKIPIGKPLPGVDARVEGEDGGPLEGAGTGELLVRTPFQTRGYLNVARNEGTFVSRSDDGQGEQTYYRTGDIVRRDEDGVLTLEGRSDFYVKVRGVRVSTQVVEQAIQEHPDVIEAAVIAVPDEMAGSKLHAVVRKEPDSKFNGMTLRKHLVGRLARTEMPGSIAIVTEPLPKTSTGKIDRKRIAPPEDRSKVAG